MKKIIISLAMLSVLATSCSSAGLGNFTKSFFGEKLVGLTEKEKFEKKMAQYELQARLVTNKGDINLYLYPNAAPVTVANFVYLAKRNFYNNTVFHRVIPNILIQTGSPDPNNVNGSTPYSIPDEFNNFLNYNNEGMVGIANSGGVNTGGSQFFITLSPQPQFNGHYTAFASVISSKDLDVAKSIKIGDYIEKIEISGHNVNDFLNNFEPEVSKWDADFKAEGN